jgi:ABC-2 type transport system permease protein
MNDFARGVVDTRTLVFYLSLTALFLFLTLRVVESRRWK